MRGSQRENPSAGSPASDDLAMGRRSSAAAVLKRDGLVPCGFVRDKGRRLQEARARSPSRGRSALKVSRSSNLRTSSQGGKRLEGSRRDSRISILE